MKKQKIIIEHELRSNSQPIIWQLISTPEGLARWIADDVQQDGDTITFTWGEVWKHHETRKAAIIEIERNHRFKIKWADETDEDAYLELRMEHINITYDYILSITDYALEEDVDTLYDLWDDNLNRLRHSSGL